MEPDDRALKWICLLDSLQQDALQKHWCTQKLKSCFLCKHKLENNFLKIVEAKGKIFKNNNKNLPVPVTSLQSANPTLAIQAGFPVPKAPLWACSQKPPRHCSFHTSCFCLSVHPSQAGFSKGTNETFHNLLYPGISMAPGDLQASSSADAIWLSLQPPETRRRQAVHPAGWPFLLKRTYTAVHEKN